MNGEGSVTQLVEQLRCHDSSLRGEAAEAIWQRYCCQLLELARQNLAPRIRVRADEEVVLQSMYHSFCRRQQRGDFTLEGRGDLWNLLVAMTVNKARKAAARHTRQRRSVVREQGEAAGSEEDSARRSGAVEHAPAVAPGPLEAAQLTEMLQRLLGAISDPRQRQIVLWKLEGYTNEEIAEKLHCAVRTVERKLVLIRQKWAQVSEPLCGGRAHVAPRPVAPEGN